MMYYERPCSHQSHKHYPATMTEPPEDYYYCSERCDECDFVGEEPECYMFTPGLTDEELYEREMEWRAEAKRDQEMFEEIERGR